MVVETAGSDAGQDYTSIAGLFALARPSACGQCILEKSRGIANRAPFWRRNKDTLNANRAPLSDGAGRWLGTAPRCAFRPNRSADPEAATNRGYRWRDLGRTVDPGVPSRAGLFAPETSQSDR